MFDRPDKPTRSYKNFRHFYLNRFFSNKDIIREKMEKGIYICFCCNGHKKIKDHTQRDVYEGLKYADYITCESCNGTGELPKSLIMELYKEEVEDFKAKVEIYRKKLALYKSIKKKLTDEEIYYIDYGRLQPDSKASNRN